MTDDLVQFLRDRLDEDAATATAASWDDDGSHHWNAYDRGPRKHWGGVRWVVIDGMDEGVIDATPQAADDAAVAQHIARHDPARVLREVEAKRQTLDDCEGFIVGWHHEESREFARDVLRNLALVHADHPDYREDWRP